MDYVEKEFKWEMAHRLVGLDPYTEKPVPYCLNCKNLHGHSYKATIRMRRTSDNGFGGQTALNQYGMIYDYNDMKVMKKWIDDTLDHCVAISDYDMELLNFVKSQTDRDKHFVMHAPTTAENIARVIFLKAMELLNNEQGKVVEVRVRETESSEARYGE